MDDKIKKYLMNNSWYHGTTLLGWKQICELKVQAKHNVGHELDFGYGFYLSPSFDQAAYYITHLVKYQNDLPFTIHPDKKIPLVIEFTFCPYSWYEENVYNYEILNAYDDKFAEFVFHNRVNNINGDQHHNFDFIFGVMSDSLPIVLIQKYKNKEISKEDVIEGLKKSTRNKQISLHKQELCDRIKPVKVCLLETREELNIVDYYDS